MTLLYLLLAVLAGIAFYLASAHQRLRPALRQHTHALRMLAWAGSLLSAAAAIVAFGVWAGLFAALTALMLVLVLLPCVDAWRQQRGGRADVG